MEKGLMWLLIDDVVRVVISSDYCWGVCFSWLLCFERDGDIGYEEMLGMV